MLVYIKPVQKTIVTGRKMVLLKDVAEVFSPDKDENKIKDIAVFEIKEDKCKNCYSEICQKSKLGIRS